MGTRGIPKLVRPRESGTEQLLRELYEEINALKSRLTDVLTVSSNEQIPRAQATVEVEREGDFHYDVLIPWDRLTQLLELEKVCQCGAAERPR